MNLLADTNASDLAALSPWAVQLAQTFVALAGDVALLVDARGVITHLALGAGVMLAPAPRWVGRPWIDTVTVETKPKIEQLLADVGRSGRSRPRQVNHAAASGPDIPVSYGAVRLGVTGPVLALGRELGAVSQQQRRFVEIQQEMERGYWRAQRSAASHQALLLHAANDAVLRIDAGGIVRSANRAAGSMFGRPAVVLAGVAVVSLFDPESRGAVEAAWQRAESAADAWVRVLGSTGRARIAATPLASGERVLRVRVVDADPARRHRAYVQLVDRGADAVFVADRDGRIVAANPALLFLLGAVSEAELIGRPLADWIEPDDGPGLVPALIEGGAVPRAEARLHLLSGHVMPVEWSAALIVEGGEPFIGGTLRRTTSTGGADRPVVSELHAALDRLALGIGRKRLPELLDEARSLAEAHLIRAALERSGGDVELAAELLGIRRADLARRSRRTGVPGALH